MSRPRDWAPLATADPVPGDPAAVHDEADRLRRTAATLRAQAAELRALAHADGLTGRYADTLRTGAAGLGHHLRQVAERYEHVHSHLTAWAGELDALQSASARLLHRARTAPPDDPPDDHRRALARLTAQRDDRAAHYAALLTAACDDVLRDSLWQRTEDAVGRVLAVPWVDRALTWLGYLASAVGLLTLCLTPAPWIVAACAAAGLALAAKDVLAAATGHGSWLDVALDAAGLLGGYAFSRALHTVTSIRTATKAAAERAAATAASERVLGEAEDVMRDSYRTLRSRATSRAAKAQARQNRGIARGRAQAAAAAARLAEREHRVPEPLLLARVCAGGEKDLAKYYEDIKDMRSRYPHDADVHHVSRNAGTMMGTARSLYVGNTVIGDGSQYLGATSPGYQRLQDRFTLAVGSQW